MHFNYIALAIPLFVSFMLLEYFIAKRKGYDYFQLHNSIANISIGIAERLADVLIAGFFFFVYDTIQKKYGIFHIKSSVAWWILIFLLTDLVWYWYHRLAHEINLLWMVHEVHHQSEDFNYTVSARVTIFQAIVRTGFWAVLPLLGFPAGMITSMLLIHGLYPFFIHTRVIGKLGILEYILVTPSHHRVHHASNEKYLDKNYGDVLIIWDKLFGTFQKEEDKEEIVYGLTKPLKSYSFLWQHFHFAIEMILALRTKRSFREKWKVVFGKPEKIDPALRAEAEKIFKVKQAPEKIEEPLNKYVVFQILFLLLSLFGFIAFDHSFSSLFKTIYTLFVVITLINCGAIMEQKIWVFRVELVRASLILSGMFFYPEHLITKCLLVLTASVILIIYYRDAKAKYLDYVY
ncbi:MAG: sterol desaturase family protein [Bacteroidota bacterium]